jgi:linoleoyl-CoA desaturase
MQKVSFPNRIGFYTTLKQRVDQYFVDRNLEKTGNWKMYSKSMLIFLWLISSYILLVFFSTSIILSIISALALSQAFVLVGFNIMHDGGHGSYSKNKKINWVMGFTMDIIGGSQMLWQHKHNILHHTYTNIHELDSDLHTGGLLRLSPNQKWRPWHRYQHLYAFPIYSLLTLSWMTYSDFQKYFSGRIGSYKMKKPTISESTLFFTAKIFYFGYTLILPMFFHPVLYVLIAFIAIHLVLGFTLSIVFQLAHTVDDNTFPSPDPNTGVIKNEWAIHEIETTANFAIRNKIAAWYLGGLNFQIEHHLFTKVCHIHYPAICSIVERTCKEYGISYVAYPTVRSAISTHYKFLRNMGLVPV